MPPKNKSVGQTPDNGKLAGYKIQRADLLSDLEREVDALVKEGWIPSGGIVYVPFSAGNSNPMHGFYQPLVKEG